MSSLSSGDILQERTQECLSSIGLNEEDSGEEWTAFKESLYNVGADTLRFVEHKLNDWLNENDPEINKLTDMLHKTHTDHLSDETREKKKQKYQQARQLIQQKLWQMKNNWLEKKATMDE
ncbi:hypothetical protein ACOMHN_020411 [Nucella lapillus]